MRVQIERAIEVVQSLAASRQSLHDDETLFICIEEVHKSYIDTVQQALSFLVQNEQEKCQAFLQSTRDDLEDVKHVIADIIANSEELHDDFLKLVIEYLFTRARLVDEVRSFPSSTLELLERTTLNESVEATVSWLEVAMTGKNRLFEEIMEHRS